MRIVGANFGADAVLERSDDFSPRRVIFRVCRKDQLDVEGQAHGITLNLHVALLHDVEQAHLNFAREVGKLVDGEDAAVRAWKEAVMDRQLARKRVAAPIRLDGVEVADDAGDRHVGSGEFFYEAALAGKVGDGRGIAALRDALVTPAAQRPKRVVVDFAAGDHRHLLVEQFDERPEDAALGLAAQPEKDEIVPGKQGVRDPGDDRVLKADNAGEDCPSRLQTLDEVRPQLVFHASGFISRPAKLAESVCFSHSSDSLDKHYRRCFLEVQPRPGERRAFGLSQVRAADVAIASRFFARVLGAIELW